MKSFNELIQMVQNKPKTVAVAASEDHEVLKL